jgi:hypothetical protein
MFGGGEYRAALVALGPQMISTELSALRNDTIDIPTKPKS